MIAVGGNLVPAQNFATVGTLPIGYRPVSTVMLYCGIGNRTEFTAYVTVESNGVVKLNNPQATGYAGFSGCVSFPIG